jgi:3-isopropylmalate dehydrogenase
MLRYSFDLSAEADAIEKAVEKTLEDGYRTADIYTEGTKKIGTSEMGTEISGRI